jgi:hypothetical protein
MLSAGNRGYIGAELSSEYDQRRREPQVIDIPHLNGVHLLYIGRLRGCDEFPIPGEGSHRDTRMHAYICLALYCTVLCCAVL